MENCINQTDKKLILHPTKILALNQRIAFCYIINQSIIAYAAGSNIILENIRTHQQIMVWVNQDDYELQAINNYQCNPGEIRLALVLKSSQIHCHIMKIFDIDWSSYFHQESSTKQIRLFGLDYQSNITMIQFDESGDNMALIDQNNGLYSLILYCTSQQRVIAAISLQTPIIGLNSFQFDDINYFISYNKTSIQFYSVTCKYYQEQYKITQQILQNNTAQKKVQQILQIEFEKSQKDKILIFILTNSGSFKVGCMKDTIFQNFVTYDLRIFDPPIEDTTTTAQTNNANNNKCYYPSVFTNHCNKVMFGYSNCRKIVYITYSLLSYTQYTITKSQDILFYHNEDHHCRQQLEDRKLSVVRIASSRDNCIYAFIVIDQNNNFTLMVIDTLKALSHPQSIENPSEKIFGNFTCRGKCYCVAHLQLQSSFFILYEEEDSSKCSLAYYCINYPKVNKVAPPSFLQWQQNLKAKALEIQVHELNRIIAIVHEETVKIHYYSRQKLYECYANFNIPNCQCCAFTPLGDKILLAGLSGIFIADAYTFQVITIISSASYLNKIPRRFMKISPYTMGLEVCSGNNYFLYDFNLLGCMNLLGSFQNINSQNLQNRRNTRNQILSIDQTNQIIIEAEIDKQIRFYGFALDKKINNIEIPVQCIQLQKSIDLLLLGTTNGTLILCKWPQILGSTISLTDMNPSVISIQKIHSSPIISIKLCSNYRYIYTITKSGEISIIQFLQEHSSNISRSASLTLLKKSNNKPLQIDFTITSLEIENRRAQNKIKMVGKQVSIQKKNQMICQNLKKQLDLKIKQNSGVINKQIKEELYSEEKIQKSITNKIQGIKISYREVQMKKKFNIPQVIKQNQQELRAVFAQRTMLQQKMEKLMSNFESDKERILKTTQSEYHNQNYVFTTQISSINKDINSNKKVNEKYQRVNQKIQIQIQQNHMEDKIMMKNQLEQQLSYLRSRKNNLRNSIRKITFDISQINQKQKIFAIRTAQVYNQLQILQQKDPVLQNNVLHLCRQLQKSKEKNERLMDEHLEEKLKKQDAQRRANISQNLYDTLFKQIKILEADKLQIEKKKIQLDDQFYVQNRKNIQLNESIQQMEAKIIALKNKRDEIKRKAILKRKKVSRSLFHNNFSASFNHRQDNFRRQKSLKASSPETNCKNSPKSRYHKQVSQQLYKNVDHVKDVAYDEFEELLAHRQSHSEKIERMNIIKNEKIKKCIIINDKLIDDNKKLTSQLNQLRRYNQFLVKKQAKLKIQMRRGSLSIKDKSTGINSSTITPSQPHKTIDHSKSNIFINLKNKGINNSNKLVKKGFFSLYNSAASDSQLLPQ